MCEKGEEVHPLPRKPIRQEPGENQRVPIRLFSDLIENLRKAIELLRGKYYEEFNCENEIEELMNPLKAMQEEIQLKTK